MSDNGIPKFDWRSRIIKFDRKPANQFTPHPMNPRKHPMAQREAVGASLGTFGQIAPVIENATNGYLVDGAERIWQALAQGDETLVDYVLIDLSEEEHEAVLKTYDGTTYLATYDMPTFEALAVNFDMPPALEVFDVNFVLGINELPELLANRILPDEFPEYDESVEDDVEYITCPHCQKEFPK